MKLHELKASKGANTPATRKGRGAGSGNGKTAGFGHKGQKARSGVKKAGFEGGQMPLQRRLPKFGFKNINRIEYQVVNLSSIQTLAEKSGLTTISVADMLAAGLANAKKGPVKVLGNGELTAKVEVVANAFSKSAEEAIQNVGGTATKL